MEVTLNTLEAIAKILKLEGVEWIATFPSNPLIEAVAKEGIRLVMFRQERGAVMAADGFSRTNCRNKFGVVITQGGPGAENAMGGIAQAYADNVPILLLPGGPSLGAWNVQPNFAPSRAYGPIVKSAEAILNPQHVGNVMRRAFHALRNGKAGPVVVETPDDVGSASVSDQIVSNYSSPKRFITVPSVTDVRDAVKELLGAKRPVIWAGAGVLFGDATRELKEFSELTGIPVYTTMQGKSSFPEDHPLSLGAGSSATTLPAFTWLKTSDVLFALGSSLSRTTYGQSIPAGKVIIQNTDNIQDINKEESVDIALAGDVKATLVMILDEVKTLIGKSGRKTDYAEEIETLRQSWMLEWNELLNSDVEPINTYRVVGEIERNLDKDKSIVTHDAGAPRDSILPFYKAIKPHGYIGWGKTTHLGFGIPLMIGAKIAYPDRFCLNLMGDGAFGMSGLDIETAVRAGTPITTVVLNNAGMATYPGQYEVSKELFGIKELSGDYAQIAEGMGAVGITVTSPSAVGPAIKQAQQLNSDGKTVLIDVHSDLESRKSKFS
tara:strand:- start:1350 stop:2999 length:1650 start_codon:yes stop_codon:yes gene_type:complete